jgi:hypothetical protein
MVDPISGGLMQQGKEKRTKQRVKKARPIRSVVSQWLDADYHKFTEAVVRVLMADQRETA